MDGFESKLKCSKNENVYEVEEIISNILSRLPVKSLLICKSVCKYWRSLISSPSFMHLHLIQSQENPTYVFYRLTKTDGETTERIPGCDGFYFKGMISSFNGLICRIGFRGPIPSDWTENSILDIRICNPATREVLLLPPTAAGSKYLPKVGVSFGPTINEYKVFQFFCRGDQLYECKVYSSITGSWRSIGSVAHEPYTSRSHVCINGIAYWFSKSVIDGRLVGHILAVDREEIFYIIRIPEEEILLPFLVNLEGCLCLLAVAENENRFDIWALKDSKESIWVKKWSDCMPLSKIKLVYHVAVRKNEILLRRPTQYLSYNMETRTWKEFNCEHRRGRGQVSLPMAYTESLLPCSGRIDS